MKKPRFNLPDPAPVGVPDHVDPSLMNQDIEWLTDLSKWLGRTVVVVEIRGSDLEQVLFMAGFQFERLIGDQLRAAKLGEFDSIERGDPAKIFFYLSQESLPTALTFLTDRLAALKVLPLVKIAVADLESKTWRIFHPAPPGIDQSTP